MKLSTKGRYGLRAMVDIAVYSQDSPVPISAIAERQNISVRYLEQLLPKSEESRDHQKYSWSTGRIYVR